MSDFLIGFFAGFTIVISAFVIAVNSKSINSNNNSIIAIKLEIGG